MSPSTNRAVPVRPVNPALRRARRPCDSLTILTYPLPLAASVTAGTARGRSNHGHTHTVSNTCIHEESPQQFGQYGTCPISVFGSMTSPTSLRPSHTSTPLVSPTEDSLRVPHRHALKLQQPHAPPSCQGTNSHTESADRIHFDAEPKHSRTYTTINLLIVPPPTTRSY